MEWARRSPNSRNSLEYLATLKYAASVVFSRKTERSKEHLIQEIFALVYVIVRTKTLDMFTLSSSVVIGSNFEDFKDIDINLYHQRMFRHSLKFKKNDIDEIQLSKGSFYHHGMDNSRGKQIADNVKTVETTPKERPGYILERDLGEI